MHMRTTTHAAALIGCGIIGGLSLLAVTTHTQAPPATSAAPAAVIDLMTDDGVAAVKGQWRYSDVKIVEASSKPSDDFLAKIFPTRPRPAERMTYSIEPRAGEAGFDDSSWPVVDPKTLRDFRSGGQFCFAWYRINITIPERAGAVETAGMQAVFTVGIDDMAEVWVNGKLPASLKGANPNLITGWNTSNHVPLGAVKAGDKIQIAVFGINGPISAVPTNRIFVKEAKLEFAK